MSERRAAQRALVDRVLNGDGRTSTEERARAFGNANLSPPLDALIDKVATNPTRITDADFTMAANAGYSEDQVFELVICAAVGQSTRRYDAGLAALDEATAETE
ncbi:hypothetical protein [Nocardia sp. NPDC050406]|uniref:hypothetical protein n=1 Tax=Nocardia sp. NPDC050406 TaxID=3364318 RepID=UPI0037A77F0C